MDHLDRLVAVASAPSRPGRLRPRPRPRFAPAASALHSTVDVTAARGSDAVPPVEAPPVEAVGIEAPPIGTSRQAGREVVRRAAAEPAVLGEGAGPAADRMPDAPAAAALHDGGRATADAPVVGSRATSARPADRDADAGRSDAGAGEPGAGAASSGPPTAAAGRPAVARAGPSDPPGPVPREPPSAMPRAARSSGDVPAVLAGAHPPASTGRARVRQRVQVDDSAWPPPASQGPDPVRTATAAPVQGDDTPPAAAPGAPVEQAVRGRLAEIWEPAVERPDATPASARAAGGGRAAGEAATPAEPLVINVSVGRVEVVDAPPAAAARPRPTPRLSLDDYLAGRR